MNRLFALVHWTLVTLCKHRPLLSCKAGVRTKNAFHSSVVPVYLPLP